VDEFERACALDGLGWSRTERLETRDWAVARYSYHAVAARYRYAFEALRTRP
jgi:hypothetical protein